MSFLRRLFSPASSNPAASPKRSAKEGFKTEALVLHGPAEDALPFSVEVVGESRYQDALWRAVGDRKPVEGRRQRLQAVLMREPRNEFDANAIAVLAATPGGFEKVGYLPRKLAADYVEDFDEVRRRGYEVAACEAVIVGGAPDSARQATYLGIWLHLDDPGYIVPEADEDPRTYVERERSPGQVRTGASRDHRSTAGMVRGKHYTEWVGDITALKRHKAHAECCELLLELIDAVEREALEQQVSPAPWYYEQLAIVRRKMRDFDGEVAAIERYLGFAHPTNAPVPEMADRLAKAVVKRDRAKAG